MGVNLQLLGIQAIPRLAKRFGVRVKFPEKHELFGMPPADFQKLLEYSEEVLARFFKEFGLSWWDVYNSSDIGMERTALAREMRLQKDDLILDVGCGRGYFSVAAAKFSRFVVGLDLMNEYGRRGWWKNFRMTMHELNLLGKVTGVRSDATFIPFKNSSFTSAVSVHSARNFPSKQSIEKAIGEMKRVVAENGNVIVVESLPVARTKAQEAHLQMFECKVKYVSQELNYFPAEEWINMFRKVEFKTIEVRQLDYNLSAAPPLFYLDISSLPQNERENAKETYDKAVDMIRKYGEASPPAILIKATK